MSNNRQADADQRIDDGSAQILIGRSSPIGILQNNSSPMAIDNSPFLYLIHGSKAADAGIVIV